MSEWPKQITDSVRVDVGPYVRRSRMTKVTRASGKFTTDYAPGELDAYGKKITEGGLFHYVDWHSADRRYTVYQLRDVDGKIVDDEEQGHYQVVSRHDTADAALKAADKL